MTNRREVITFLKMASLYQYNIEYNKKSSSCSTQGRQCFGFVSIDALLISSWQTLVPGMEVDDYRLWKSCQNPHERLL